MNAAPPPPAFAVRVTHHRLRRGVLEAAGLSPGSPPGLPAGFEPVVRGCWNLADTLELRLLGAPDEEPPVRVHRLRVQAMTHAGDLLAGGWALSATAGPTGLDVLRGELGPLAEGFAQERAAPAAAAAGLGAGPTGSVYPLRSEAAAAAAPAAPWLLPLPGARLRVLRFAGGGAWTPAPTPAAADRFWSDLVREAGFGEAAAESRVVCPAVTLRWRTGRPRPLLRAPGRATRRHAVAAVA